MNDLIYGTTIEEIEKITGEDLKIIKKWKNGTKPIPEPTLRLLKLYLTGDASALLGDEWKGYRFRGNYFMYLNGETALNRMKLGLSSGKFSKLEA